jgi:hypothetical protein
MSQTLFFKLTYPHSDAIQSASPNIPWQESLVDWAAKIVSPYGGSLESVAHARLYIFLRRTGNLDNIAKRIEIQIPDIDKKKEFNEMVGYITNEIEERVSKLTPPLGEIALDLNQAHLYVFNNFVMEEKMAREMDEKLSGLNSSHINVAKLTKKFEGIGGGRKTRKKRKAKKAKKSKKIKK